jgi:hypothetical protein
MRRQTRKAHLHPLAGSCAMSTRTRRDVALAKTTTFEQSCRERKRISSICSPQAHPPARSTAITRTTRDPSSNSYSQPSPRTCDARQIGGATADRGCSVRCLSLVERCRRVTSVSTRRHAPLHSSNRQAPAAVPFARGAPAIVSRLLQQNPPKTAAPAAGLANCCRPGTTCIHD